jgi:hypothetical protein
MNGPSRTTKSYSMRGRWGRFEHFTTSRTVSHTTDEVPRLSGRIDTATECQSHSQHTCHLDAYSVQ